MWRRYRPLRQHPKDPYRFGDILNVLLAEVFEVEWELIPYVFLDSPRDTDAARFCQTFQPRRDVDAVAVDLLAIDDHVAEVDTDAELHPALGWQIRVLGLERGLDLDGALDRIHDACKLRKYTIARGIYEAPVMPLDQRIDQLAM